MIKVLSFLSNENCFVGHSRGRCGPHVARGPRFEHHWYKQWRCSFAHCVGVRCCGESCWYQHLGQSTLKSCQE